MIKIETDIKCYIVEDGDYLIGKEEFFVLDKFTDDFCLKVNGEEIEVDFNKHMVVISNLVSGEWLPFMVHKINNLNIIKSYDDSTISYWV